MNDMKFPGIYLDFAATTPVDSRVVEAMIPYFDQDFGNTSSIHNYGQAAEKALEDSRDRISSIMNCSSDEILFTSCGSESDNLALRGVALAESLNRGAKHILISPVEHHAVSETAHQLSEIHNFSVEYLPVDRFGMVSPDDVHKRIRPDTALISVIYANNEIGTINPITQIGQVCQEHGIPLHTDAVQAAAYLPLDTQLLNVDLMSIGAHKFYGPKGVGALYKNKTIRIIPEITGGSQEFGLRAGTHNTPYIVGMAEALCLVEQERERRIEHVVAMRKMLVNLVLDRIPGAHLTGHPELRMPNHASFVFEKVDGNALLMTLSAEGFAVSSGSACKTGDPEPSEVLLALGMPPELASGSLRVTLGTSTEMDHVETFLDCLPGAVERVRKYS